MNRTWPQFMLIDNGTTNFTHLRVDRLADPFDSVTGIHVVIIAIDFTAIIANSLVIMIIMRMPVLRKFVSSLLLAYLCILDILAAAVCLSKFFRVTIEARISWYNDTFCGAYEFLNSFFVFAIIGCILTINLDKYHSIKYPMHYSNTVTKTTMIIIQGFSLFFATLFALSPILLSKNAHLKSCVFYYSQGLVGVYFSIVVLLVYFVLPSLAMTLINISVYRVAKHSLARISVAPSLLYDAFCLNNTEEHNDAPNPTIANIKRTTISVISFESQSKAIKHSEHLRSLSTGNVKKKKSPEVNASFVSMNYADKRLSVSCGELTNLPKTVGPHANRTVAFVNKHTMIHTVSQDNTGRSLNQDGQTWRNDSILSKTSGQTCSTTSDTTNKAPRKRRRTRGPRTNYKALRNLVIPFMYFIVIWGTYFYAQFLQSRTDSFQYNHTLSIVSGLLVHFSFALNPIFYVWMRKNFKEEATEFFRKCRRRNSDASLNDPGMGQTFEQFLEASSTI